MLTPTGFESLHCGKSSEARDPTKIPNPTGGEGFSEQLASLRRFFIPPSGLIHRGIENCAISWGVETRINSHSEGLRATGEES